MARAAVIPQSPPKRTTRTRTKGSTTTSTSTKPAPKTTKAKAPSSATEARKRGVRTTSAAASKPVEDDSDESTDDEIGMVDQKEKVKTTVKAKGRPATKPASSTTGGRGRKPAKVDSESDNDDELAQSDAPKKRAGRPRAKPVSTPAKPETVAPKARGRPKGSTAATKASKPVDPVRENTRLNAKGFTDLDFSSSQDAPRRVFIATNSVSSAARSNLLRGPAKKKKVTFQDPSDSAEEEMSEPSPPPAAGRRRGTIVPGRQAGLASKPVRRPAATSGRGRKPAAATAKKDGPKPLSPKKATQVAKALSSYANSDSEDDELSGEKDQIKFVVDSPAKHGSEKTGLSSPVKKINLTGKFRKSLDENGEPLPGPRRSIDFNDTLLMSSPARRPPPSPFNFTMRETPKRGGFTLRDDAKQLSQPDLSPTHNSPLKLSPRKAHLETPQRGSIFRDGGKSLSQPNFTPGHNSPLKSSPRKGLFGMSFTSQAHAESTSTPLRHSVSFLQSPAKKIASPFKSSLFASRSTIEERPTAEEDANIDAPATPDVDESPLRMTDFERHDEVESADEQADDAPAEEVDALDTTKEVHALSPAVAEIDGEVESEDEQVDDAPPEEVDALDTTGDIHAQSPVVPEQFDEEDTLHEEFDREETIEYEQEDNNMAESVAGQDEHPESDMHAVQDAEETVDEAAESEEEIMEEPMEDLVEPVEEPVEEFMESTEETTEAPTAEPIEEAMEDFMDEPLEETVQEPSDVPMEERAEEPVEEPTESMEEPVEEPVEEIVRAPVEEPVDDRIDESAEEPTQEPVAEPTDEPIEVPMEQPMEESVEESTDNGVEAVIAEPVEEPMEDPLEESDEEFEEAVADPIDEPVTEPVAKPVEDSDSEQVQSTVEDLGVAEKSDIEQNVEELTTEHAEDNADPAAESLAADDRESTVEIDDTSAEQAKNLDQEEDEYTEVHEAQDEALVADHGDANEQPDHETEEDIRSEVDEEPEIKNAQNPGLRHSLVEGLEDVFVEHTPSAPVEDDRDSSETEDDPDMLEAGDENATDIFDDFDDDVSERYPFDDSEPTLVAVEPTEHIPPNPQPILPYEVEEPEGSYSPTRQIYYTRRVLSPVRFIESPVRYNVRAVPLNYGPAAADSQNEAQGNINLPDPFVEPRQATPRRRSTRRLVLDNAPRFTPLAQQFSQWKASSPAKAHPKRPRRGVFSLGGSKRSSNVTTASEVSYPNVSSQAQSSSSESPMPEASTEADVPEIYEDKDQEQEPQSLAADAEVVEESSRPPMTEVAEDIPAPAVDASEDKENEQEKVASVTDSPIPVSEPQAVIGPQADEDKENQQQNVTSVPESPVPASKPPAAEDKMNGNIPVLAPFTPMKNRISQMQTVHTVSKVPLKPEGEISPLKISRKRGLSFSAPSPGRSSRPRPSTLAPVEQSAPSISPRKSPRLQRVAARQSLDQAQAPPAAKQAVQAQASASHKRPPQSPSPKKKSKTPRTSISAPKLALQGAVAYVDVHTTEGEDASGIFIELLQQMGARCVKNWSWNPRASVSPEEGAEPKEGKVGITHVIYKDGGVRTLEKVRHARGLVKCVGVGWVLDCERENKWLDESHYEVDLSIIPRGGAKRRKSMEPRALSNINGTLVKADAATNRRRSVLPPKETTTTTSSSSSTTASRDITPSSRNSPATPQDTPKFGAGHTEADQDFCHTPKTPGYTFDMDAIGMSPATPFYLSQRSKLVQQTCPPKQTRQGLFTSATPAREPNQKLRAKLEAARRKSMAYKPRVGSPLVE